MERRITAIKVQKHNPDRLSIDLDGEFAFGLSRIVAAWLKVGDTLSEQQVTDLMGADSSEKALQSALKLLDYRPRTEKEIRQRLYSKGYDTQEIENVIKRLREANLVHDQQFAQMWVENRCEFHPRSQRMIRYELRNKGVSETIIDQALTDGLDEAELAKRAAERYALKLDPSDRLEFRKKLSAFLARRGFSYGTVAPVVNHFLAPRASESSRKLENEDEYHGTD